jgi:DnaJ family protein C protein 28
MSKIEKNPKKKAIDYKRQRQDETPAPEEEKRQSLRNEQDYRDLVGWRVEEAMRAGAFDNLRGKGKPLNLQRNPFVPEDMEMAYSLLQNNDLVPGWISDRGEIQRAVEQFRLRLRQAVAHYLAQTQARLEAQTRSQLVQSWHEQLRQWEAEIVVLNRRINTLNLQQPSARLELFKLRLDEELARAGMK